MRGPAIELYRPHSGAGVDAQFRLGTEAVSQRGFSFAFSGRHWWLSHDDGDHCHGAADNWRRLCTSRPDQLSCSVRQWRRCCFCRRGKFRSWFKVKLAKNFFQHRYDYRSEWIRFHGYTIGRPGEMTVRPFHERVVKAIADITDSPCRVFC